MSNKAGNRAYMQEIYKSLLFALTIYFLSYGIFIFVFSSILNKNKKLFAELNKLYFLGLLSTIAIFVSKDVWIYLGVFSALCLLARSLKLPVLGVYVYLLCTTLTVSASLPTFNIVNYLFAINQPRILSLTLLLPFFITSKKIPFFKSPVSISLTLYFVYLTYVNFIGFDTFTGGMRAAILFFLDVFLVFYCAASVRDKSSLRVLLIILMMLFVYLAMIGIFEVYKNWWLFFKVPIELNSADKNEYLYYLFRNGLLRARSTTNQSIAFGCIMIIPSLVLFYLNKIMPDRKYALLIPIYIGGVISALSRGPWVGLFIGLCLLTILVYGFRKLLLNVTLILLLLTVIKGVFSYDFPFSEYLPWIGNVEHNTIVYRQDLIEQAIRFIPNNFWTGSVSFNESQIFNSLKEGGGGKVDTVNTYLFTILYSGFIGLFLYCSILFSCLFLGIKCASSYKKTRAEIDLFAAIFSSILLGFLVTIGTVSSISFISNIIWLISGLCYAIYKMSKFKKSSNVYLGSQLITKSP